MTITALESIKKGDTVRYQYTWSDRNYYDVVKSVTKLNIITEDGTRFKKATGWSSKSSVIDGVNDREQFETDDFMDAIRY